MTKLKIKKNLYSFEKIGVDEIEGLKPLLKSLMKPLQEHLKQDIYWDDLKLDESEYKGRDGFIPHSDNHGGIELTVIIPYCEQYDFGYLEFGEMDPEYDEESQEADGHLDAKLRVWLKFEGIEEGKMNFWLYAGGGNGDAPYFRTKYETDIFETSFTAKTLTELKTNGKKAIQKLIKKLK